MTNKRIRLVIADPSLLDPRGHHYSLTLLITRGAQSLGYEVLWFTHKDFIQPESDKTQYFPIFSTTMYERHKPETMHLVSENIDFTLEGELIEGINKANLCKLDHIFIHTCYGDLYKAIDKLANERNLFQLPYIHVCTPYDLKTMPGKKSLAEIEHFFTKLHSSPYVDKKIFFWTETPQLANYYTTRYGFNMRSLPLPPPQSALSTAANNMPDKFTILYLGAAREEKGFLDLPEIVDSLYENFGKSKQIQFIIQCTPQIIGYLPSIKKAINELSKYPSHYVNIIDHVLSEKEYMNYLSSTDVVVLLYNRENYKVRGSGIAVEAITMNKSILTYKDTFCDSLLTHGAGAAVVSIDDAIKQLVNMIKKREYFQYKSERQGAQYRSVNSIESYINKIININNYVCNWYPSNIIDKYSLPLLKI